MKCCSLQYVSWIWFLRLVRLKPASQRNSLRISWISKASDTKEGTLITPFQLLWQTFVNLLVQVYKGSSTGGGVTKAKGLVGTWGVQTNVASPG